MSNLYQDAILDAKAVRASALANAKAALEEAFEPKIQEMISKHLTENEESEEVDEAYNSKMKEEGKEEDMVKTEGEDAEIKEEELDEILNQLDELTSKDSKSMKEAKDEEESEEGDEESAESEEGEEESEESEEEATEETVDADDETKVVDITLGDLKQMIQDLMVNQGSSDMEMSSDEEMPQGEEDQAEEEVSLDEILDELEMDESSTGLPTTSGTSDVGEYDPNDVQSIDIQGDETFTRGQAKREGRGDYDVKTVDVPGDGVRGLREKKEKKETKMKQEKKVEKELREARATIYTLRKDLQEVNLLNAKYLYMNKLFKSKTLTESQKLKVINALDKAKTVKQAKRVYEIMNESLSVKKSRLKESISFASKPAGMAPKANIVESDQFISRWQNLAGINNTKQ